MSLSKWVNPLLQGLAYWVGYRKQIYPYYKLSEGAIIAESQLLISARLETGENLECEVFHNKIYNTPKFVRADLVIYDSKKIKYVIEVKRYEAGIKRILEDFKKLAILKNEAKDEFQCFVLLVSQQKLPKEFVNKNGLAKRGKLKFESLDVNVIRNCKSTASFNSKAIQRSNYCALIEVLG